MKRLWQYTALILILTTILAAGCTPRSTPTPAPTPVPVEPTATQLPPPEAGWWETAVFYEIFVRSFYDSNGDGVGDFNGITEMLDYLNDGDPATTTDLGITGIWLMPIFPSPSYHGYDVTDYLAVNPQYGTLDDFKRLLDEAHKRGIHIIIDFVINHTSTYHPWFQSAVADKASPYRDYYIWSETNPGYAGPWGQVVWIPSSTGYYYAVFWDQMPDLNLKNEKVTQEIYAAARFWTEEVGVDGFRIDAARHLIENGEAQVNTPDTHAWFKGFRTFYKSVDPQVMAVGEIWDSTSSVAEYLRGDELDLAFNFDFADTLLGALQGANTAALKFVIKYEMARVSDTLFATFLTNHDQNRVMNALNGDAQKARIAATILLTFPGVPFIYYGEEIGMSGAKPDEDIRRPMQWTSWTHAGFTSGTPWRAPYKDYPTVNVAGQSLDPDSLLSLYRQLIDLRNQNPALQNGSLQAVDSQHTQIVAYLREDAEHTFLVLANFGKQPAKNIALKVESSQMSGTISPRMLIGTGSPAGLTVNAQGGFEAYEPLAEIPAWSALVIQLR